MGHRNGQIPPGGDGFRKLLMGRGDHQPSRERAPASPLICLHNPFCRGVIWTPHLSRWLQRPPRDHSCTGEPGVVGYLGPGGSPRHRSARLSRRIFPKPGPKWAPGGAGLCPAAHPSCLHTTCASFRPQPSPHATPAALVGNLHPPRASSGAVDQPRGPVSSAEENVESVHETYL